MGHVSRDGTQDYLTLGAAVGFHTVSWVGIIRSLTPLPVSNYESVIIIMCGIARPEPDSPPLLLGTEFSRVFSLQLAVIDEVRGRGEGDLVGEGRWGEVGLRKAGLSCMILFLSFLPLFCLYSNANSNPSFKTKIWGVSE